MVGDWRGRGLVAWLIRPRHHHQAWQPKFRLSDPHSGSRKQTRTTNCPLTSLCVPQHVCTHTHPSSHSLMTATNAFNRKRQGPLHPALLWIFLLYSRKPSAQLPLEQSSQENARRLRPSSQQWTCREPALAEVRKTWRFL